MYKKAFRFEGYVVCFVSVYTALAYEQSLIFLCKVTAR